MLDHSAGLRLPRPMLGAALAALLTGGLAMAADSAPACTAAPQDLSVPVGSALRLDGHEFSLVARRMPTTDPAATDARDRLDLDLLARVVDMRVQAPRPGTYRPHLEGDYVLAGPDGLIDAGTLEFRFPSEGPAYGATVPLDALAWSDPLQLTVTLRDHSLLEDRPACPEFPLQLDFAIDPSAVPTRTERSGTESAAANVRFNLIGTLDPSTSGGNPYSDIWGWSNGTTHLAILGGVPGTHFIDVTDAANPVEVAFIPGPSSSWRDMKTYGDYAYIVTEANAGLQIVDLTDPLSPTLANQTSAFFNTAHNIYIVESVGLAYVVGANNGVRILDLSQDPVNPTLAGSWSVRYVHDAYATPGYAYFSEIFNGIHETLDASNVASLEGLINFSTPGSFTHNSWANDAETILATTDEVSGGRIGVYDVTAKSGPNPQLSIWWSNTNAYIHNVMYDDDDNDRIAIAHYTLGLKYVDLHVPSIPVELASWDTWPIDDAADFDGNWGVYTYDPRGYIFASDRGNGLHVLEYAPTGGTLSGVVRNGATEAPLAGVQVQVLPEGLTATTNANGEFAVYAEAGDLVVRVAEPGFQTQILTANMALGGRVDLDIDLAALPQGPLAGTVRDASDLSPIAGAQVAIVGAPSTTTTLGDGSFGFIGVPIGQQIVTVDALGYSPAEQRVVISTSAPAALDVLLEPGTFVDDVEADLGWDLGFLDPGGVNGRWVRVDPNGTGGGTVQPEDDHTPAPGTTAFITGQSAPGATINDNDVEGGRTTLRGPAMDASTLQAPRLRYHRWFSNDAGAIAAGILLTEVSPDAVSWSIVGEATVSDPNWTRFELDLNTVMTPTSQVRVRFRAESGPFNPVQQVLECGVDDVDLVSGCLARFSPELPDTDVDGAVDSCDPCPADSADDADGDGFCGDVDNTPFTASPDQTDTDSDLVGDAADNCVSTPNTDQRDLDGDGLGDACDPDVDGDGTPNGSDTDQDDDGVPNLLDGCPTTPDPRQPDLDTDGEGDACDPDDGIVQDLRLGANGLVLWVPEAGSDDYNLYRGDLILEALLPFAACRMSGIATTFYIDPDLPLPDEGYLYLVTRTAGGSEGSLGAKSDGTERQINSPCP